MSTRSITVGMASPTWNVRSRNLHFPLFRSWALLFRRDDGRQDPPEWQIEDTEKRAALGSAAYKLLARIRRIPGTGDGGDIDADALSKWVIETRRLCAEYGRSRIGDQYIGQILSRAPTDEDGVPPCPAVCEVMERVGTRDIASGFTIGTLNARGFTVRGVGEGGRQGTRACREISKLGQAAVSVLSLCREHSGGHRGQLRCGTRSEQDEEAQAEQRLAH